MTAHKKKEDLREKFLKFLSEVQAGPLYCTRCGKTGPEIIVRRVYTLDGNPAEQVMVLHPQCAPTEE